MRSCGDAVGLLLSVCPHLSGLGGRRPDRTLNKHGHRPKNIFRGNLTKRISAKDFNFYPIIKIGVTVSF
jgi:hypothetical protein